MASASAPCGIRSLAVGVRSSLFLLALGLLPSGLFAAESTVPATATDTEIEIGQPVALRIEPAQITLRDRRAVQQLVLTGDYGDQLVGDLTRAARWTSSDPGIVRIDGTRVRPVANGSAQVTATAGGITVSANVVVTGMEHPAPISFRNETLMALTKTGCNQGACHGSPTGKGGFRLSLRAYDPELDAMTLRSEFQGRRVNPLQPAASLLLRKPLMEVAHVGGQRLRRGEPAHVVLERWIAEGMQLDPPGTPDLVSLEIVPGTQRVLHYPAREQQLAVIGNFSDGTRRDLTELTDFSSSSEQVATVDTQGLVTKRARGETAILCRYLDKMATCYVTFLEPVPGFTWTNPPVQNFVDTLVFDKLRTMQIQPSELCTDEEFCRRLYLDVIGRLPSEAEAREFLDDPSPGKRTALIDALLASDDYASFWALKWGDLLRSNIKRLRAPGVHKFRRWIFESIRDDKPFDQFARELLEAQGSVFENPAANYWRASRDPQDATETTSQLFLGVRIQCAKCHNHPFEKWTQDNYYGIAAAFAQIGRKNGPDADDEVIFPTTTGEVTQPRTGKTMKVHLLLQGDVDVPAGTDRRVVFADWLTQPSNPFFARSIVNRIWGHTLGRGLVEPVDDFRDSNPPTNAPLLDELARQFAANGFHQKWVLRTILNSRTYQLSSRRNPSNQRDELYHSHATTRLMTAEQLLDAICAVSGVPEAFPGMPPGTRATELADPPTDHYFLKVFGQPARDMACQCERSTDANLSQALQMINGPTIHNKLRAEQGRIGQLIAAQQSDEAIISSLYLTGLARRPAPTELAAAQKHVAASADRRQALEDIAWALLNSKEFLFQH